MKIEAKDEPKPTFKVRSPGEEDFGYCTPSLSKPFKGECGCGFRMFARSADALGAAFDDHRMLLCGGIPK